MDPARLAKLQASVRIGKGTPRRKVKKVHKSAGTDDKKLQTSLKKLNVQPIQAIEEVNMFKEDGNVIHFAAPKVHASVPANTFAIYGNGEDKELTELVPGILNQLGPDSLASLRKLAESYQSLQKKEGEEGEKKDGDSDDDDIPDLIQGTDFESKPTEESKPEKKDGGSDDDIPDLIPGTEESKPENQAEGEQPESQAEGEKTEEKKAEEN